MWLAVYMLPYFAMKAFKGKGVSDTIGPIVQASVTTFQLL